MQFTFVPSDMSQDSIKVPFFEDARADFAPYYTVYSHGKRPHDIKPEITAEFGKLGAGVFSFVDGVFQNGTTKRHGYNIHFMYGGGRGIIRIAGLPIKSKNEKKIEASKTQALCIVRDWLKSAVTNRVFSPGSDVLIPFMLVDQTPGQEKTVAEYIATMGTLPQLAAKSDVIEGEYS